MTFKALKKLARQRGIHRRYRNKQEVIDWLLAASGGRSPSRAHQGPDSPSTSNSADVLRPLIGEQDKTQGRAHQNQRMFCTGIQFDACHRITVN
jgi:hypothetical protein